jgi:hypothetical protein
MVVHVLAIYCTSPLLLWLVIVLGQRSAVCVLKTKLRSKTRRSASTHHHYHQQAAATANKRFGGAIQGIDRASLKGNTSTNVEGNRQDRDGDRGDEMSSRAVQEQVQSGRYNCSH